MTEETLKVYEKILEPFDKKFQEKKAKRLDHLAAEPPVSFVAADRKAKIRELRESIKLAREDFKLFLQIETKDMTEKEKKANSELSVQKQSIILALNEDLKQTRMNTHNSKYFLFIPSASNRSMRRRMRRLN